MAQLSNQRIAWFNGQFMPENQVMIPFRDRSWKYGDGAFDMTRTGSAPLPWRSSLSIAHPMSAMSGGAYSAGSGALPAMTAPQLRLRGN